MTKSLEAKNTPLIRQETHKYIPAIAILIFFGLLSFWSFERLIQNSGHYGQLINLAGKQRMLSQKLIIEATAYYHQPDSEHKERYENYLKMMEEERGQILSMIHAPEVISYYHESPALAKRTEHYLALHRMFLIAPNDNLLDQITETGTVLLDYLDGAVVIHEKIYKERIQSIEIQKIVEFVIYSILLGGIWMFIFSPTAKKLESMYDELDSQNQDMNQMLDQYVISSTTDLEGKITHVSTAFCTICGYSREELLDSDLSLLHHPDMPEYIAKELLETISRNETWNGELKNRTKKGNFYWVKATISPLYSPAGEKIAYSSIYQDITDSKAVEEHLGKLESQVATINNNALTGLFIYDFTTRKNIYINPKFTDITGYTLEDISQMSEEEFSFLIHKDDQSVIQQHILKVIAHKQNQALEAQYRLRHKRGDWIWVHSNDILLEWDENDTPLKMLGSLMDISELIALQDQKREQEKLLIQQSKLASMGEMIANIAHQWKQPLAILSMSILALQKKYQKGILDENYFSEYVTKSTNVIERMNHTITDFSQYFRTGKRNEEFDLAEAITKSIGFLEPISKQSNIEIRFMLPKVKYLYHGTESELLQVLVNLIKNGIDVLIEKSSPNGLIQITLGESPLSYQIEVEDNGGGIDDTILSRIFEPYFTTKFKSDGTGLGLYMSKMIIEDSLNGSLQVQNGSDGAHFTISLPKEAINA